MIWRCGRYSFDTQMPVVMGILNVTPDSFSDGGRNFAPDAAIRAARAMHEAGALIIDVGGESTRPGAAPVSVEEELSRTLGVVRTLIRRAKRHNYEVGGRNCGIWAPARPEIRPPTS